MIRLGVLGSTRGTNLLRLLDAQSKQVLDATFNIVISNRSDAMILEHAKMHQIKAQFLNPVNVSREAYDAQISAVLKEHAVELVVLIGYMRILSKTFVNEWDNKIINVHPSLLPAFAGKMDLEVHRAVLQSQLKETGCTVHYVTAEVDAGPHLVQKRCAVQPEDTAETLKTRVQALEGDALIEAINQLSL